MLWTCLEVVHWNDFSLYCQDISSPVQQQTPNKSQWLWSQSNHRELHSFRLTIGFLYLGSNIPDKRQSQHGGVGQIERDTEVGGCEFEASQGYNLSSGPELQSKKIVLS